MFDTRVPHLQTVIGEHTKVLTTLRDLVGKLTGVAETQQQQIHALEKRVRFLETKTETKRG